MKLIKGMHPFTPDNTTTPNRRGLGQPQGGWDEKVCIHPHDSVYKVTDF